MTRQRSVSLATAAGVVLDGISRGDTDGLPVVLLHGLTDSWRSFELLLLHLPPRFRVLALSYRGHGDSAKPAAGHDLDQLAADVADALDRAALPQAVVVGHSLGTLVAQRLLATRPDRVSALALIGTFVAPCRNPVVPELREAFATLADPVDPGFVRAWQESNSAPTVAPAFLAQAVAESGKVPARVWIALADSLAATDLSAAARRLAVPTLIVSGALDAMCRDDEDWLAAALPQARLVRLPGYGHSPHWEDAAAVAAALVPFLDAQRARQFPTEHKELTP
jgi:pimeloyl-ACP methyl ester carboxylesterase